MIGEKTKSILNLLRSICGIVILSFICFWIWNVMFGNPLHDYLLIKYGVTVNGYVTEAYEEVEKGDNGQEVADFYYRYNFKTIAGQRISNGGSASVRLPDYLQDLSEPYPMEVLYFPSDPSINRIKQYGVKTISSFFIRKMVFGALTILLMLYFIIWCFKSAIKENILEIKKAF